MALVRTVLIIMCTFSQRSPWTSLWRASLPQFLFTVPSSKRGWSASSFIDILQPKGWVKRQTQWHKPQNRAFRWYTHVQCIIIAIHYIGLCCDDGEQETGRRQRYYWVMMMIYWCQCCWPLKVHWCQTVTFKSIHCHPGLTYIVIF